VDGRQQEICQGKNVGSLGEQLFVTEVDGDGWNGLLRI
jgi:hypothetical protein